MQYRAIENIRHDGHDIAPGELIDLTAAEAAKLLASGAIEPVHKRFSRPVLAPGAKS